MTQQPIEIELDVPGELAVESPAPVAAAPVVPSAPPVASPPAATFLCELCLLHRPLRQLQKGTMCCKSCHKDRAKKLNDIAVRNAEAVDRLNIEALANYRNVTAQKILGEMESGQVDMRPPDASELIASVINALGGKELFAMQTASTLLTTAPGSATRATMLGRIHSEARKVTELGLAKEALKDLSEEEIQSRVGVYIRRVFGITPEDYARRRIAHAQGGGVDDEVITDAEFVKKGPTSADPAATATPAAAELDLEVACG